MQSAFRAIVSGRVQMVMFRDFTQRKARSLSLVGEVENKEDGTVSVFAEGEQKDLEAFVALLRKGPLLAHVDDVTVEWMEPKGAFEGFSIRYS